MRVEYQLSCRLWLPLPIAPVFTFFADAHNLAVITPPWLNFVIHTPGPIDMRTGCLIDYTIHWLGIPIKWRTVISAYDPPDRFEDRQLIGPYAQWIHQHEFASQSGGTLVRDRVRYIIPGGFFGPLAQATFVRRQLTQIFEYRQAAIARLLMVNRPGKAQIVEPVRISRVGGWVQDGVGTKETSDTRPV